MPRFFLGWGPRTSSCWKCSIKQIGPVFRCGSKALSNCPKGPFPPPPPPPPPPVPRPSEVNHQSRTEFFLEEASKKNGKSKIEKNNGQQGGGTQRPLQCQLNLGPVDKWGHIFQSGRGLPPPPGAILQPRFGHNPKLSGRAP